MNFTIGQRWVSQTEPQLGLGLVIEVSGRRVTVSFPAADEERTYATDNAPLARVRYQPGDLVYDQDHRPLTVESLDTQQDLFIYAAVDEDNTPVSLPEVRLSPFARFTRPEQRLFCGQSDRLREFTLRYETLQHMAWHEQSPARGLIGSRTNHLQHQVYIAGEVSARYAPRVLLADEVGLGKTIEAGMILHQRILTGQAQRVLIVVPEPLVHQWLVEMLRRFNLKFSVFDQSRFDALEEDFSPDAELEADDFPPMESDDGVSSNPFESEQQVICSLEWLTQHPEALEQALAAPWDLMVVDEAHHLAWSPESASPEYQAVEQLAQRIPGVLLLTATPEQAGPESHFARLRLLDPARFASLEKFQAEADDYNALNRVVQELLQQDVPPTEAQWQALEPWLGKDRDGWAKDTDGLIRQLLDCHGTSRVLFRNTRAAVRGFPLRQVLPAPLETPELYGQGLTLTGEEGLFPETQWPDDSWLEVDPRVPWLEQLLRGLRPAKVLVICAHAETARALEHHLQLRAGIRSAAFYEDLSLIERDRAAAYFASEEQGAQALICSEIGSEGRNFQFAQHLVLFDLPPNPDLLEQRIGRLDRIGQAGEINIHVPYLADSAQSVLFRWYQEGLDAFSRSCAVGIAVREKVSDALHRYLENPADNDKDLLEQTRRARETLEQMLEEGRDALIELNSCNPEKANALIEQIEAGEEPDTLSAYMTRLFDQYGVDHEPLGDDGLIIRPSDHLAVSDFPHLPDEGLSLTFDRETALTREDLTFLSWEHPLVQDSMEMLLGSEQGNATVGSMSIRGVQPGTLLLEAVYRPHCPAPRSLNIGRFLNPAPVRFLTSMDGRDLSHVLTHEKLNSLIEKIKRRTAQTIVPQLRDQIEAMLPASQALADKELPPLRDAASTAFADHLNLEISRLRTLKAMNPGIREEEVQHFEQQLEAGLAAIDRATLELDSLRIVIST